VLGVDMTVEQSFGTGSVGYASEAEGAVVVSMPVPVRGTTTARDIDTKVVVVAETLRAAFAVV
jgi:hypothetical protein